MLAVSTLTPIDIADHDTAVVVDGYIKKVEQVSGKEGIAAIENPGALHRCVWRCVGDGPMLSSIKCMRNVDMPDTGVCC